MSEGIVSRVLVFLCPLLVLMILGCSSQASTEIECDFDRTSSEIRGPRCFLRWKPGIYLSYDKSTPASGTPLAFASNVGNGSNFWAVRPYEEICYSCRYLGFGPLVRTRAIVPSADCRY